MRKFRPLALLSLAIIFIAGSCTKEGPEGPVGAAGPQGPAGNPGAPGAPGAGQTSYSAWFTPGTAWNDDPDAVLPYAAAFIYEKTAPAVTQTIIDQGIVLSYAKGIPIDDGSDVVPSTYVVQLPFTEATFLDVYDFALKPGQIVYTYKAGVAPWLPEVLEPIALRYVVIPGTTLTGRNGATTYGGYTAEELEAMTYEQVSAKFNIPAQGTNIR